MTNEEIIKLTEKADRLAKEGKIRKVGEMSEASQEDKEKNCKLYGCIDCPISDRCSLGQSILNYDPVEDFINGLEKI